MQALVRLAEPRDLADILVLYRELRPNDPQLPQAGALLNRILGNADIALVVCECEGTLAATCMLAIVPSLASGGREADSLRRRGLRRRWP
jgi:hypothetical protein